MGELILFSANTVVPVYILILLGFILRKKNRITVEFIQQANFLVFYFALPSHLFLSISGSNIRGVLTGNMIPAVLSGTLIIFLLSFLFTFRSRLRGEFVQASMRSNSAFIGLPLAQNALGEVGTLAAAQVLAILIPVINILSLLVLLRNNRNRADRYILSIIKNPLIISILLGILVSYSNLSIPGVLHRTLDLVGRISLPLALLGVGGSMVFGKPHTDHTWLLVASTGIKIIIYPAITVGIGFFLGMDPVSLLILFILTGTPTAIVSHVTAEVTGNKTEFTISVIMASTIASLFTISTGIICIKSLFPSFF